LNYRDFTGIRTPTFIDIEDNEEETVKQVLMIHGIDKYTIVNIESKNSYQRKKRKCKKSLKSVNLIGASNKQIKMSLN